MRRRLRVKMRTTKLIAAPEVFNFLSVLARQKLFSFLELVKAALSANMRVVIDFKATRQLHPGGTLIFLAHIDLWLDKYPGQLTCRYPEDPVVEELLQHVSALSKLGLTSRKVVSHERVKHWLFHCGTELDSATYSDLTKSTRSGIVHPYKELFADCLNEAVANTIHHAYEYPFKNLPSRAQQKWWMLSLLKDDELFVAIYDAGIGIPGSLRRKPRFAEYFKMRNYNDARLIQAAVGSTWSSTQLPHRGNGLPEMLEFSQNLEHGGLSIWSENGGLSYNPQIPDRRNREVRHHIDQRLPGTLVLWSIPFRKEQDNANDIDT